MVYQFPPPLICRYFVGALPIIAHYTPRVTGCCMTNYASPEMAKILKQAHASRDKRLAARPRHPSRKRSPPDNSIIPGEIWTDLAGYDYRYQISDHGRIRKADNGKIKMLTPTMNNGYRYIKLSQARVWSNRHIHRLVLEAFVGPRPPGAITRHLDGNPSNNRPHNLAWGTHQENADDRVLHGRSCRGETHGNAKLTNRQAYEIRARHAAGEGPTVLAKEYGVALGTVEKIVYSESWTHLPPVDIPAEAGVLA